MKADLEISKDRTTAKMIIEVDIADPMSTLDEQINNRILTREEAEKQLYMIICDWIYNNIMNRKQSMIMNAEAEIEKIQAEAQRKIEYIRNMETVKPIISEEK